jgi:aminoglycoside phosphotransferase (APT) family kinase protein
VAKGQPSPDFPRPWSIYRWLDGQTASVDRIDDLTAFAAQLGNFLAALYRCDPDGGPPPGAHSFNRGGPISVWNKQMRQALKALRGLIDTDAATAVWEAALAAEHYDPAVWVHGDISGSNLLVVDGHLAAVIDFGCSAVGDPACDTTIAWTMFQDQSRDTFKSELSLDDATWARGRGWVLWKALITLAADLDNPGYGANAAHRWGWRWLPADVVEEVISD